MRRLEAYYEGADDGALPAASLLDVRICRRRTEAVNGQHADLESAPPSLPPEIAPPLPPEIQVPPLQGEPRIAETVKAPDFLELIELWANDVQQGDFLPRQLDFADIRNRWRNIILLEKAGFWPARKLEIVFRTQLSLSGIIDGDDVQYVMSALMEQAQRSFVNTTPLHESIVVGEDERSGTEIGILTLPVASNGRRPDFILSHLYVV